jgi:hypothetical protein
MGGGTLLVLFAAGIALLALLFASYCGRHAWIACASTGLSLAAVFGLVFLSMNRDPAQIEARSAWLADQLTPIVGRQTRDEMKTALGQISSVLSAASAVGRQAMQAASTTDWFGLKERLWATPHAPVTTPHAAVATPHAPVATRHAPVAMPDAPAATPRSPVKWLLDDPNVPASPGATKGFLLGGLNVSDQDLKDVRGVLKLDSSPHEIALSLTVEGRKFDEGAVVPAGARFSLGYALSEADGSSQFGGALLRLRYSHSGQRKATILHLTAPVFARLANRG